MAKDIWFTADLHLGHASIIKYCNRPFSNVDHMNEALIENWNTNVKPQDTIYVLGDFGFGWDRFLPRLNGNKILIIGNHDRKALSQGGGNYFDEVHEYLEISLHPQKWILFHFPIFEWHRIFRGSYHLHGHTHGTVSNIPGRIMDVGVDCHAGYSPWHADSIIKLMERIPPRESKRS